MEVLEKANWIFKDPHTGDIHPINVYPIDKTKLSSGCWYVVGEYVYECIGSIDSIKNIQQGQIFLLNGNWKIEPYKDKDLKRRFSDKNVFTEEEYNQLMERLDNFDELMDAYIEEYEQGYNLMEQMLSTTVSTGGVFLPELKPDDDPFEKVIKSMLLHLKVVLNDYKRNTPKPHIVDNLRSALSGATKNMSVTKFLLWCEILQLDWEIRLSDADDYYIENKLKKDVVVTNKNDAWVDINMPEDKNIFVVKLSVGEDPLKRAIKLALNEKRIDTAKCEDKSSSPHLINNMKSALKNKQKMTMLYFMSWCELLDVIFIIKVTDPKTGIYYQVIGYDLYTNAEPEFDETEDDSIYNRSNGNMDYTEDPNLS